MRREKAAMRFPFLTHPATTFAAGVILAAGGLLVFLNTSAEPNNSAADVDDYRAELAKIPPSGIAPGTPQEKAALSRFTTFITSIGDASKVRELARSTYDTDAYLDDTLAIHRGESEIEKYFVKTNSAMSSYQVTIDDIARSGEDFYVRWTMIFAAKALSGGKPVHSSGISQLRFTSEGKVRLHRDYWDSGQNFYAHLPVAGGAIGIIHKRLQGD
jgi:hypothetical protein